MLFKDVKIPAGNMVVDGQYWAVKCNFCSAALGDQWRGKRPEAGAKDPDYHAESPVLMTLAEAQRMLLTPNDELYICIPAMVLADALSDAESPSPEEPEPEAVPEPHPLG